MDQHRLSVVPQEPEEPDSGVFDPGPGPHEALPLLHGDYVEEDWGGPVEGERPAPRYQVRPVVFYEIFDAERDCAIMGLDDLEIARSMADALNRPEPHTGRGPSPE